MKLTLKLTLASALAILTVMAVFDYVLIRRQLTLFDQDIERILRPGKKLGAAFEALWRSRGEAEARRIFETMEAGVTNLTGRWLWLEPPPGDAARPDLPPDGIERLRRREIVNVVREDGEGRRRVVYVPMTIEGAPTAVLELTESLSVERAFIETTHRGIIVTTIAILALSTAAVVVLGVWFVGRPIQRLRDQARAVAAGDFRAPLALRQHDEIGELGAEIDAMCERVTDAQRRLAAETEARIAALEQMRHTDRLTTLGQLASGVAHELGTPLSVVAGRAEMIASGEAQGAAVIASARTIAEQATRMAGLIRQLLDFSRRQGTRFGVASLRAIATRAVDVLAAFARRRGVRLELETADDVMIVSADENQIQQALTNVIMNGVQAMPDGGRLLVTVRPRRARPPDGDAASEDEYLCVTVEDQGHGITPEHLAHIFEPFFTTKGIGEGTGLGLSVAYGIVREHGGWIAVDSEVGKGSRFCIFLPRAADAGAPGSEVAL
jgi:signal transduction histidine kinase